MKNRLKSAHVSAETHIFTSDRTIHWMGNVNQGNFLDVMDDVRNLMKTPGTINLVVTSAGGPTGIAMSFYDSMRKVYRPRLVTVGAGDVDSSGVIVFLAGSLRYIASNTTMLLHLAGRTFDPSRRYTVPDMEAMLNEDRLKDFQYASVIAENSSGRLSTEQVLSMMAKNTILSSIEAVKLGIAHKVL